MAKLILLCGFLLMGYVSLAQDQTELPLSSLKNECKMEKWWLGAIPDNPWGAWLICAKVRVFVTHPRNLLGQVDIQTTEQALEYVRFFTSSKSSSLFHLQGMVEVLPGREDEGFNVMNEKEFNEHFEEASAKDISPGNLRFLPGDDGETFRRGNEFVVSRTVLFPNNHVYRIVEMVQQDGWYKIVSKTLLLEDARKIGIYYFDG